MSAPEAVLIVLRHGTTTWSANGRFIGHQDPPLSDQGRRQARVAATQLNRIPVHYIICSDLQRARCTADIIAETVRLPVHLDRRLREEHLGAWEGLTAKEVAHRFPASYDRWQRGDVTEPFDGREGLAAVGRRMLAAVEAAVRDAATCTSASPTTILLVTHLNAAIAITGMLTGFDQREWPMIPGLRPGSWVVLDI